ncbi:MAG: LysR family transcriptional regulator [Pseudomonadales bacterium]|nr:LysR family transcriptional regulator [Pseudomonadales bacterium]
MAKLDSLNIFSEVVATKNFSTAAKNLGITPSAVSKQISQLESRLGVQLLNRTTRSVNPTEAGEIYYSRIRRTLDELAETESLIADMDTTPRGTLRIAAEPIFGRAILARIISTYREVYPEVKIELFLTDHSLERVKDGFDLGIHLGQIQDAALKTTTLANHNVVLCASKEYIKEFGQPDTVYDLTKHRLIKISAIEFRQVRQLDDFFENIDVFNGFHLTVNDIEMAYQSTLMGIGIAPLPNYLVNPQIEIGTLQQILPRLRTPAHPVQLFHQVGRQLSSKTESFRQFIINYFQN